MFVRTLKFLSLGEIFGAEGLNNPVVGLMIGIIGTVLVQSSSAFTSIIIGKKYY